MIRLPENRGVSWLVGPSLALILSNIAPVQGSDYGSTGLIDIPSARMQADATLTATAAFDQSADSYSLTYQATPWLEANFRYSGSFNVQASRTRYWDRNYGFKVRLFEEGEKTPQLALGVRDLIGTGVFGSEYIVASKRLGRWDATAGIAWGRLAGSGMFSNPLGVLDSRFNYRPPASSAVANAGTIRNFYFRGDAGLFGGLEYHINDKLKVLAEYNPDKYQFTNIQGRDSSFDPPSPFSYGVAWQVSPDLTFTISQQHLDQVAVSFKSRLRTNQMPSKSLKNHPVSSFYLPQESLPKQINKGSWYDRLLYDAERRGLLIVEGTLSGDGREAQLVVGNVEYQLWGDAISEHLSLADLHLPPSVENIYFVLEDGGHRVTTLIAPRPSKYEFDVSILPRVRLVSGRTLISPQHRTEFATGTLMNTVTIGQRLQLFDPDNPARYQVMAVVGSEYTINNHWSVRGAFSFDIDNNFDESNRRESDSQLPNVRTGVVKYLSDGATGLDSLVVEGRDTLGHSLHYRLFGGVLEEMFSGVGGELLWWPSNSRLAFGVSLAKVKQRDYDKSLKHLDYEVITGFVSGYWATPWYEYDVAIHAGQYLAKDVGVTFDLRRTFRNGWQVGLFATKTNVSSEEFGEGSFDKGFFFQVPIGNIFGGNTRSKIATRIRPVLRDGGQRLESYSGNIFWDLRQARYDAVVIDERLIK